MKHTALLCLPAIAALLISGCTSTHIASAPAFDTGVDAYSPLHAEQPVALTTLGPAHTQSGGFRLGAGDALGQAIYANYATLARANAGWQYADATVE